MPTTAEAARHFFQGAMHLWMSAPHFKGVESRVSLNDRFDGCLREHLPVIARKRGADAYIGILSGKVEEAYSKYERGDEEGGRQAMLDLLNLIHTHLHLPSARELRNLSTNSKKAQ